MKSSRSTVSLERTKQWLMAEGFAEAPANLFCWLLVADRFPESEWERAEWEANRPGRVTEMERRRSRSDLRQHGGANIPSRMQAARTRFAEVVQARLEEAS